MAARDRHSAKAESAAHHGVLVVDKPAGMTSAAVVARAKRATGARRVGHTGTLDPMATGVLPLCVGEGTKLAPYLLAADKEYTGSFFLGVETDTLDREGEVVATNPAAAGAVTATDVRAAMADLVGPIEQVPPMYSAIRHGGRRLHELAREGKVVDRPARPVTVHLLELVSMDGPRGQLRVRASKGTYVRSLVADMGRALGCGAHLDGLRRVRSGEFGLEQAVQLAELTRDSLADHLIPPERAISHLPAIAVPPNRLRHVGSGLQVAWDTVSPLPAPQGVVRLLSPDGGLVALARVGPDHRLEYERVFTYGLT